jgi:hypothetical protein
MCVSEFPRSERKGEEGKARPCCWFKRSVLRSLYEYRGGTGTARGEPALAHNTRIRHLRALMELFARFGVCWLGQITAAVVRREVAICLNPGLGSFPTNGGMKYVISMAASPATGITSVVGCKG